MKKDSVFDLESCLNKAEIERDILDQSSSAMRIAIRDLVKGQSSAQSSFSLISNSVLKRVYRCSTAFGFTLHQNLAAVERVLNSKKWMNANAEIVEGIYQGEILIGLATTHLASDLGPRITGIPTEGGYLISGVAAWASGCEIFDRLIVGFYVDHNIAYALMNFPSYGSAPGIQVTSNGLDVLNGSSSVNIKFKSIFIPNESLISVAHKDAPPGYSTQYIFSELGIVERALDEIEKLLAKNKNHPTVFFESLDRLKAKLTDFGRMLGSELTPEKRFEKDELIRDCVRVLILISGGRALMKDNIAFKLYKEIAFLDVVLQPVKTKELKYLRTLMFKSDNSTYSIDS